MSKKWFLVCIGVIIAVTVGTLVFYLNRSIKEVYLSNSVIEIDSQFNSKIRTVDGALTMISPKGWAIIPGDDPELVDFMGPDIISTQGLSTEYRCKIAASSSAIPTDINAIKESLAQVPDNQDVQRNEIVDSSLSGYGSVTNIFQSAEVGFTETVYVPLESKLYFFSVYSDPKDEKICGNAFRDFLSNISISR